MVPAQSGTYRGKCGPRPIELSWAFCHELVLDTVLPEYPPNQTEMCFVPGPDRRIRRSRKLVTSATLNFAGACTMTPLTISLGCCLFRAIYEVMKGGKAEICSVMAKKSACCLDLCRLFWLRGHGIETRQFSANQRQTFTGVTACRSSRFPGPVSGQDFFQNKTFWVRRFGPQ
jgi:hypothetical protein